MTRARAKARRHVQLSMEETPIVSSLANSSARRFDAKINAEIFVSINLGVVHQNIKFRNVLLRTWGLWRPWVIYFVGLL